MEIKRISVALASAALGLCLIGLRCNNGPTDAPMLPTVEFSMPSAFLPVGTTQIVDKNSGTAAVDIALSAKSKSSVTVPILVGSGSTANNPADYTLVSTSVVIPAGDSTGTIHLSLVVPASYEKSKTVVLSLGAPTNAKLGAQITDTVVMVDAKGFGLINKLSDNELTGWQQDNNSVAPFLVYTGEDLINRLDGTADGYLLKGCLVSMYQNLAGPDGQICTFLAMDFGTAALADSEYFFQAESDSVAIPEFDRSVAIGYPGMAGTGNVTVYAHFKAMYFEIALSGFADPNESGLVASRFLQLLQSKNN